MDWPETAGIAGLGIHAASASRGQIVGDIALDALAAWTDNQHTSRSPGRFPFGAVLDHYHAVGRHFAATTVVGALTEILGSVAQTPETRRFTMWLRSATDQAGGDYSGYSGLTLLDDFIATAGADRRGETADALALAALTDLLHTEIEALTAAPVHRQYQRTRAAALALCRAADLAPLGRIDATGLQDLRALLRADSSDPIPALIRGAARLADGADPADQARDLLRLTMMPVTILHDEVMFIRLIQVFEMQYMRCLWALEAATEALQARDAGTALRELTAVSARLAAQPALFHVLTTMPRSAFAVIRKYTQGRSAVQSRSYREMESTAAPALWKVFLEYGEYSDSTERAALGTALRTVDRGWRAMKKTHWGITLKIIGEVPGTGGTSGASYLRLRADEPLFPAAGA
ncbi:hypothetical protein ACIP5Y_36605 [Nocardia sp. NPDC088792]|uniref:hypothetical protein n=1 Tax=Nocardia sp. NPDC088792 TaxID=3364332 RepID=UPI003818C6D5